jgi:hypothetical protein
MSTRSLSLGRRTGAVDFTGVFIGLEIALSVEIIIMKLKLGFRAQVCCLCSLSVLVYTKSEGEMGHFHSDAFFD